jgi:hypothetical protein
LAFALRISDTTAMTQPPSLQDILGDGLDDNDADQRPIKQAKIMTVEKVPDWIKKHGEAFAKVGLCRPSASELMSLCHDWEPLSKSMFLSLPDRSRELVFFMESTCTTDQEVAFDVSQTFDFCHARVGIVGVLAESSKVWLLRARRLIFGPDAFALQGGTGHHYVNLDQIDPEVLSSLAGNAFNGPVCMNVLCSLIGSIVV